MNSLNVFVSSPSDVALEREITRKILEQLRHEYRHSAKIAPYFWEYEPQDFSQGYQPQIPHASTYDIVICIFFSRIGTPLTVGDQTYPSGSAYELLEAKEGKAARIKAGQPARPHILVFVNQTEQLISVKDEEERDRRIKSWDALKKFLDQNTRDGDEYIGAINRYQTLQEFESKVELKIRRLIEEHLSDPERPELGQPLASPEWQNGNPYRGLFHFEFEHAPVFFGRSSAVGGVIQALQNQVAEGRPRFVMILGASGSGKSSLARAGVLPTLITPGVIEGVGNWRRAIMKPSGLIDRKAIEDADADGDAAKSNDSVTRSEDVEVDLFKALAQALLMDSALPELMEDMTTCDSLADRLRDKPEVALESIRGALRQAAAMERARQTALLKEQIDTFEVEGRHADLKACRAMLEQGMTLPTSRLVLLVDQFEELYTGSIPGTQVMSFTQCLRKLAEASQSPVFVIATVPSDFYADVVRDENLAALLTHQGSHFPLPAPTDAELTQMIRLPALAAGLRFDVREGVSLDEQLLSDARSNPDCLPLLEFCLEKLADRAQFTGLLTFEDYNALGTLSGVLAQTAEETLNKLEETKRISSRQDLDLILGALIARDPNHTKVAVRRPAPWDEVTTRPESKEIVEAFIRARLLVRYGSLTSKPAGPESPIGDVPQYSGKPRFVSVAHEALLRNWEPAKEWIGLDENQEFLRRRERLERSHHEWLDGNKQSRYLLHSAIDLAEAQVLIATHPHAFREMHEFVSTSVRRHRIRRYRGMGLIVATVLTVAALFTWSVQQQANVALAGQLVAQSDRSLAQKDFAGAEIVSAKALTIQDSPETRLQLLRARSGGVSLVGASSQFTPNAQRSTFSRTGDLSAAVVSPRGNASCSVSVFRTSDRKEVASVGLDYIPECLTLNQSDDHTRLLACARPAPQFDIELWSIDLATNQARLYRKLDKQHTKRIPTIAFHPSKPWLADGSEDKTLRLWDYASDPPTLIWDRTEAHGTNIHGIAFNGDGTLIGSGGGDYLAKIWDIRDADHGPLPSDLKPKYTLSGHVDSVFTVAFSPDGQRLASGGYDRVIRIWDLPSLSDDASTKPRTVNKLEAHEGTVLELAFSADSNLLASGSKDKTVKLWHVDQSRVLATLRPDCGDIRSIAYMNFGGDVYCGGENGWGIWSVRERAEAGRVWNGGATVTVIAFDPLGEYLAVGADDGKIRMWDREHRLKRVLESGLEGEWFNGIAFDAQGRWLAAGGEGQTIHIWDRNHDWRKLDVKLTHGGPVWGLCFDPQGSWLATCNSATDICIKKWDTVNWSLIAKFGESSHSLYALGCYVDQTSTRLVTGDADAHVIVRDASTGEVVAEKANVTQGERNVWSVAICPDPLSVISGNSDGRVRHWQPDTKRDPLTTSTEDSHVNPTVNSVSYSKKHSLIAAGGDGRSVEIYDLNMSKILSLYGQDGTVWWVAFEPDGSRLAYGGTDGIIRFWNIDEFLQTRLQASPAELYRASQKATGLSVENGKVVSFMSGK